MRNIYLMAVRELKGYFFSMVGYVVWSVFLLIYGFVFWILVNAFSNPQNSFNEPLANFFFGTFYYWFIMVIFPPLITMRSIAEEKKSGTFELLMSVAVTDLQVILSKFIASFIFFSVMWCSTIYYFYLIAPHTNIDWIRLLNGYFGTLLLGSVFISLGIFASAVSKNQIIAGIISFGLGLLIFSLGFISYFVDFQALKTVLDYINIMDNAMKFSQGIFDTRPIVFFCSLTTLFLFMATRALESEKWN